MEEENKRELWHRQVHCACDKERRTGIRCIACGWTNTRDLADITNDWNAISERDGGFRDLDSD